MSAETGRGGYTKVSLRDVDDVAPRFGFGEFQEARFPREDVGAETIGFAHVAVKPGRRQTFAHRHERAEEVYLVLGGSGVARLDGEEVELAALDAVRVAPEVTRAFAAGPDGLEYVVFGPHHAGDGEILDAGWDR